MEKIIQKSYIQSIDDPRLFALAQEAASVYNLALKTFWK